jgi:muconolactone delta-isomerase
MKVLALEKEVAGVVEAQFTQELLQAEAAKAWELYQAGVLRELYFHAEKHEAVLILECDSVEEARSHLASLPLVDARLIDFEIIPLAPYPGFSRLFALDAE